MYIICNVQMIYKKTTVQYYLDILTTNAATRLGRMYLRHLKGKVNRIGKLTIMNVKFGNGKIANNHGTVNWTIG